MRVTILWASTYLPLITSLSVYYTCKKCRVTMHLLLLQYRAPWSDRNNFTREWTSWAQLMADSGLSAFTDYSRALYMALRCFSLDASLLSSLAYRYWGWNESIYATAFEMRIGRVINLTDKNRSRSMPWLNASITLILFRRYKPDTIYRTRYRR